eukprot:5899671-Pleurochrysis_carterae.AAC.1
MTLKYQRSAGAEGNTATGGCRASLTYGWGLEPRAAPTFVQSSVSILPLLRRVSGNVSLTPRSPVAGTKVHPVCHAFPCAPPRGRWVGVSNWHVPAGDDIASGAQGGT